MGMYSHLNCCCAFLDCKQLKAASITLGDDQCSVANDMGTSEHKGASALLECLWKPPRYARCAAQGCWTVPVQPGS